MAETVPALCHNGTFHWILPNGSAKLTFLKTWFARSVCITNSIFEVQDVTNGELLYANGESNASRIL